MISNLSSSVSPLIDRLCARRWTKNSLLGARAVVGRIQQQRPGDDECRQFNSLYSNPLPHPKGPMRVFHLGHSLVGRDMPAMLAQLAPKGHAYESQLGWGTTLKAHWGPKEEINVSMLGRSGTQISGRYPHLSL